MSVRTDAPAAPEEDHAGRTAGLLALGLVILSFSMGSTLVKLSHTPGVTVAFWRMIVCSVIWIVIMRVTDGRWLNWADIKASLVPGVLFGLNICFFFTGITKTTVAAAEFTGSLSPLLVVPAGALFFKERVNGRAMLFGLISLAGLALVLFNAPPSNTEFSWVGVAWVGAAMGLWAGYLLTSRNLRQGRTVAAVMAAITPIAAVVTLPLGLFVFPGTLDEVTWRSVVFIGILAIVTGTTAHGLMVYAQKSVPIGLISMLQVSQPALAVLWSVLMLDATVRGIQLVGMALVIAGLAAVTFVTQRGVFKGG